MQTNVYYTVQNIWKKILFFMFKEYTIPDSATPVSFVVISAIPPANFLTPLDFSSLFIKGSANAAGFPDGISVMPLERECKMPLNFFNKSESGSNVSRIH